ncbi:MAG: DUF547 domain-containing protein [Flavobacteriales bacterium]|nr:DUF547 domain-containing protein [Flavobacteriales bacterium]
MKKLLALSILPICLALTACSTTPPVDTNGEPVEHNVWDELVKTHVSAEGNVSYKGFIADSLKLNRYLGVLSNNHPNHTWSKEDKLAYWINAYNAFTVQLIIRNYPTESIKDLGGSLYKINTPWDIRFIMIEGKDYDLNNIEHDILRKEFNEARIHFAVNCASVSCPKLLNEAYQADKIYDQLDRVAREFINNPKKNKITTEEAEVSKLFKWFSGDFEDQSGSVINFINQYSDTKLTEDTNIDYLDYDWGLNE